MMIQFLFSFMLLSLLFILSQKIISYLYLTFFLITKARNTAIGILAILLLPGTIIHELSHFLFALLLHVPTGKLSIFPTIEKGGEVHAGKLTLGDTDPFRLALIGLAPLLTGIILLYSLSMLFFPSPLQPTTYNLQLTTIHSPFLFIVNCYLLIVVSVTMFSSKKDIQPLKIALPITALVLLGLYYIGIRMLFTNNLILWIGRVIQQLNNSLLLTSVLDTFFFACIFMIFIGLQKLLKRKIEAVEKH